MSLLNDGHTFTYYNPQLIIPRNCTRWNVYRQEHCELWCTFHLPKIKHHMQIPYMLLCRHLGQIVHRKANFIRNAQILIFSKRRPFVFPQWLSVGNRKRSPANFQNLALIYFTRRGPHFSDGTTAPTLHPWNMVSTHHTKFLRLHIFRANPLCSVSYTSSSHPPRNTREIRRTFSCSPRKRIIRINIRGWEIFENKIWPPEHPNKPQVVILS